MTISTPIFVATLCGAAILGATIVAVIPAPPGFRARLEALVEDQQALRREVEDTRNARAQALPPPKPSAVEESANRLRALRDALAETRESPDRQVQALSAALAESQQDFVRWHDASMVRLEQLQALLQERESQNRQLTQEVDALRAQLQRQPGHPAP
jgi:hypothetical protein